MTDHDAIAYAVLIAGLLYFGLSTAPKLLGHNGRLMTMAQRMAKTDEIKSYGGNPLVAQQLPKPYPFELVGLRYDDPEAHQFVATRKTDTMMALRFMNIADDNAGELGRLATLLIGKSLDNTDGVPVQWSAEALPKPANAGDSWEPKFRGPDGKLHPMHQAAKFEDFGEGSSRRRWEALMVDNQFTMELEAMMDIAKDLIEMSTGTPTDG